MEHKDIAKAVKVLQHDGVIVFPTDTVWGIGCSIESSSAIAKLYQIKGRAKNKPTAVLINSLSMAKKYGEINRQAQTLMHKYWPGGLTIVVKAKTTVPQNIQGWPGTVGLRMPNQQTILQIINKLNCGLVAGSANFNKQKTPLKKNDLDKNLVKLTDYLVEGELSGKAASTVIETTSKNIKILRLGSIKISPNF